MSIEETIKNYVQQQFEEFQLAEVDEGSEIAASSRIAASIEKNVHIIALNDAMKKIGLNQKQASDDGESSTSSSIDSSTFLIPLLVKYIDAALTMEINVDNKHVVRRVFDLVSALACGLSSKSNEVIHLIIDRVQIFSTVISERLRSQACTMLGCFASHLIVLSMLCKKKNSVRHEKEYLRESLSMIEKLLLPRLTDKSQSVRHRAIQATGMLFGTSKSVSTVTSSNPTTEGVSSPALLEGLLWSMWHDPSVANRVEAIQAVPIDSAETLDHVIARIRDVKEKVRNAAINALRFKVDPRRRDIMTEEHFRDIVRSGLTERCERTNIATMTLICTKWTKAARFCPVELMRFMGATMYEEECEKALQVVLKMARVSSSTKSNPILQELSDPEIRSLCLNIDKSMIRLIDSNVVFDEYQLFYTRVACSNAKESSDLTFAQKEDLMTKTTPDIPTLCDLLQKHLGRFVESIQEQDEECIDQECFVCLQLLQLAKIAGLQEEGSRRHFAKAMIDILANAQTPDELVEECVEALRATFENELDFFNAISVILANLTSVPNSESGDNKDHARVLFIFSVVLENAPSTLSTHDLFNVMAKIILSAVANPNTTIREVGIGCFGKLGLLSNASTILSEFRPILLKIAAKKEEAIQCRGQSLLALSDWTLVFPDILQPYLDSNSGESVSFLSIVRETIQHTNGTLATIAAEVATKLLFSVQLSDGSLLASLLVSFLDPNNRQEYDETNDHDIDIKDVGSPLRLQQLLSLFFPSFCLKSEESRNALLGSIEKALLVALDYSPKKKGKIRSTAFPLVKIVEYVCSVVTDSGVIPSKVVADATTVNYGAQKNYSSVSASLQVATFLVENEQRLKVTQLRPLCKFLGNQEIRLDDHDMVKLGKLKDLTEELSFLEDSPSLTSLRPLTELLSSVKGYEDNNNDDDDEDEGAFDGTNSDVETISENNTEEKDSESVGETTIEDEVMMNSIARLSLENKENPPSVVKTSRRNRRSSTQSNVSVLESLGSPNA
jgi:condensin complex subunit 3